MDAATTNAITTAITSVGFPIVMCLLMWYQMQKNNEMHKEEVDSLKDVINDVKIALTELRDAINRMDDK